MSRFGGETRLFQRKVWLLFPGFQARCSRSPDVGQMSSKTCPSCVTAEKNKISERALPSAGVGLSTQSLMCRNFAAVEQKSSTLELYVLSAGSKVHGIRSYCPLSL